MASPIDNYEMHAAKKYLEYTETPLYRAFRDLDNPVSAAVELRRAQEHGGRAALAA